MFSLITFFYGLPFFPYACSFFPVKLVIKQTCGRKRLLGGQEPSLGAGGLLLEPPEGPLLAWTLLGSDVFPLCLLEFVVVF